MTTQSVSDKRAVFRKLHEAGHFVMPNPWDLGSLRRLEKMGFKALASTSAGCAWALGQEDGELTVDQVLDHLRSLCAATDLPINADFEGGFADDPEGVAVNVTKGVDTGVAGLSIEDRIGNELYPLSLAIERIQAAREAIDATGQDVLLIGRTEDYVIGHRDIDETIKRLVAYAAAGADVLYAPWVIDMNEIRAIVAAVAPKPVNVLLHIPSVRVADLAEAGVRRTSTGARLASAAWAGFERSALSVRDNGHLPV